MVSEPEEFFIVSDDEPITVNQQMMAAWSPLDAGVNQMKDSESEMEDDNANLDESFEEQSPPRTPFTDDGAAETTDAEDPTRG